MVWIGDIKKNTEQIKVKINWNPTGKKTKDGPMKHWKF